MKKLLLSVLLLIPFFCIANNEQQIDKATLQSIRNEVVHVLQETEENFNDMTLKVGDLSTVFLKMANECLSHNISQKLITETSINVFDVILEQKSVKAAVDNFVALPANQNDIEEFQKVWQDVLKKYAEEVKQIYHQMVDKCDSSDISISLEQCEMLHISFYDFPQIYVMVSFTKAVCMNILQKIDAVL